MFHWQEDEEDALRSRLSAQCCLCSRTGLLYLGKHQIRIRCQESEFSLVEEMSLGRGSEKDRFREGVPGWVRMKPVEETMGRLVDRKSVV